MKNVLYVLIVILMVSCGSNPNSVYEETISKQLLRGSDTKENLNFKIVELTKHGTITAADSIAHLTDEFRKDKQLIIDRISLAKKMTEDLQVKSTTKHNHEKYITDIAAMNRQIDSLKNVAPTISMDTTVKIRMMYLL